MAEPDGFYYMRARYYDPAVGRFISEDPLGFDGGNVNLYEYVHNNPVNRIDPEGLGDWVSNGPHWYEWRYEPWPGENESIRDMVNRSGIAGAPKLEPLGWPFEYYEHKKDKEQGTKTTCGAK